MFIKFQLDIKMIFPNIPISHGICFVFFMYLNKFIVKVKRDILTFFVQPCLSPFQLDRGLMTHIKLKSFKHEWIYLKVEFDFRLHLLKTYFIFLQLKFIYFVDAHILNLICLLMFWINGIWIEILVLNVENDFIKFCIIFFPMYSYILYDLSLWIKNMIISCCVINNINETMCASNNCI